jgi:hypothetical protein
VLNVSSTPLMVTDGDLASNVASYARHLRAANLSPDLDTNGNIFATSGTDGFTRRRSDGAVLWKNTSLYRFLGWQSTDDGDFARVRTGSGKSLFIHRAVVVIVS